MLNSLLKRIGEVEKDFNPQTSTSNSSSNSVCCLSTLPSSFYSIFLRVLSNIFLLLLILILRIITIIIIDHYRIFNYILVQI